MESVAFGSFMSQSGSVLTRDTMTLPMRFHRSNRSALWALTVAAALPLACGDPGGGAPKSSISAAPSASAAIVATPTSGRDPVTTQGSALALMPDESQVVLADEDHEALILASSDLSAASMRVVQLPGPPAQLVALDGFVFVTVRTLPTEASRAVRETTRGAPPTPEGARTLEPTKVLVPALLRPEGAASASSSASATDSATPPPSSAIRPRAGASASASAKPPAAPKAPAPPRKNTAPILFDPSIVRQSQGGLLIALRTDAERGLVEVGRVTLAPDAWGLALTPDRKRAVVTSAWSREIAVVDVTDPGAMKVVSHDGVAREPRGVAISPDGKTAFVSHLVGTALTRIDDLDGSPKVAAQPLPSAPSRALAGVEPSASLAYALVFAPDGKTLYVPRHALGAEGIGSWWGAPTVDALDVPSGKPLQPARAVRAPSAEAESGNVMRGPEWTARLLVPPSPSRVLVQPRAVVYRRSTRTLLVASEGSDSVAELGTLVPDPAMDVEAVYELGSGYDIYGDFPARGGAPTGLALTRDESALLVFCRSTFDLARIDLATGSVSFLHFADDGLPRDAALGRRLFANARSATVSGGLGCAACHPDGRDDGYVWREGPITAGAGGEERFVARRALVKTMEGDASKTQLFPRQTPMLAGRVRADGPYGWHGQNKDLLERLIEGFHLHRAGWDSSDTDRTVGQDVAKIDYLADFIRSGLLPPPTLVRDLDETEKKGKAIYEGNKAQCTTCHLSDGGSDRKVISLAALPVRGDVDSEADQRFKVPSLTFVAGTAPYFHDGSAATLEDLIRTNGQRMGNTSQLGAEDQAALAAYLRTL